jgi:hypothetical protein
MRTSKKLTLNKSTLRTLSSPELNQAIGQGQVDYSTGLSACDTPTCAYTACTGCHDLNTTGWNDLTRNSCPPSCLW